MHFALAAFFFLASPSAGDSRIGGNAYAKFRIARLKYSFALFTIDAKKSSEAADSLSRDVQSINGL
ncbi:hypothetical protein [Collimonas pratensis]|uniref:Uncharacterized protein n=1 Tax=Collimonas pratensis TaxID=279113 RepID=A0ABM5Z6E9_9BURK|nr:hypothetical protein [Collimonas pratensis]AMP14673.1 hypothetical protein CPter291_2416 [Collimonas pratensis]